jgi:hypothetical protein
MPIRFRKEAMAHTENRKTSRSLLANACFIRPWPAWWF